MHEYDGSLSTYSNVENHVRSYLTHAREARERDSANYVESMVVVYDEVRAYCQSISEEENITFYFNASDFNKLIGDMKKLGIVGTTQDSGVFLSDVAWQMHLDDVEHQKGGKGKAVQV
jgi:hypothetical protein